MAPLYGEARPDGCRSGGKWGMWDGTALCQARGGFRGGDTRHETVVGTTCAGVGMGFSPHWYMDLIHWGEQDRHDVGNPLQVEQWLVVHLQLLLPMGHTSGRGYRRHGALPSQQGRGHPRQPARNAHIWYCIPPTDTRSLGVTSTGDPPVVCRQHRIRKVIPGRPGTPRHHHGARTPPRVFPGADQEHLGHLQGKLPIQ